GRSQCEDGAMNSFARALAISIISIAATSAPQASRPSVPDPLEGVQNIDAVTVMIGGTAAINDADAVRLFGGDLPEQIGSRPVFLTRSRSTLPVSTFTRPQRLKSPLESPCGEEHSQPPNAEAVSFSC